MERLDIDILIISPYSFYMGNNKIYIAIKQNEEKL
tara:strand:- start:288 stop:392 length:105 start_codon:yes stop_codon:yes gene_type:complete